MQRGEPDEGVARGEQRGDGAGRLEAAVERHAPVVEGGDAVRVVRVDHFQALAALRRLRGGFVVW